MAATKLLLLLWFLIMHPFPLLARRFAQSAEPKSEAAALLLLPAAVSNWAAATANLTGLPWRAGTDPCGSGNASLAATPPWKGVTCSPQGQVTAVELGGLGLAGTLPAGLLTPLPALAALNLSRNAFSGGLPRGWSSSSLQQLDLCCNQLNGTLPASWGGSTGLRALASLHLQSNNLSGILPVPQWVSGEFAQPAALEPRPGNPGLCGPVPPLSPQLYSAAGSSEQAGTTTLILTQKDLFTPGTEVTITNWLGMCMRPCAETGELDTPPPWVAPAGLTWPPTIQTNAFDISFVFNMSISDLLNLNPGLAWFKSRQNLSLPCYPSDEQQRMAYSGGDVAYGKFAGGNQRSGTEGLAGAMAAAQVVLHLPGSSASVEERGSYTGSLAPAGGTAGADVAGGQVEPVYWFVDLLAPFQVSAVFLRAGQAGPLRNASLYVGSDPSSVFGNTLVASGLNAEPGQQLGVAANATVGRYAVVYTGAASEGQMSLADAQVYTVETNAAANKPVSVSALSTIDRGGSGSILQDLVDNNVTTCVPLQADPSSAVDTTTAWAWVDLGYVASVGAVAVAAGPGLPPGTNASVYVTADTPQGANLQADAEGQCEEDLALQPGGWAVAACDRVGRYVTLRVPTPSAAVEIEVCELQVALTVQPHLQDSDSVTFNPGGVATAAAGGGGGASGGDSGGVSGGEVAGIVLGAVAGVALLLAVAALTLRYARFRSRWIERERQMASALDDGMEQEDGGKPAGGSGGEGEERPPAPGGPPGEGDRSTSSSHRWAFANGGTASTFAAAAVALPPVRADSGGDVPDLPSSPMSASGSRLVAGRGGHRGEWELIGEFAKSLRRSRRDSIALSKAASMPGSAAFNASLFPRAKIGTEPDMETHASAELPSSFGDVSPKDIQLVECVGEGSYGQVWRGRYFGATVAVKILSKPLSPSCSAVHAGAGVAAMELKELRREAHMMSSLRHPNVCRYLGACMVPPCLLMEYCSRHSLDAVLAAGLASPQMAKQLDWVRLLGMALDAANGMLYLHRKGIAHRDCKSPNLLVDAAWRVKVADFSFSRPLENNRASTVVMANPRWLAPEVINGQPGQLPADVFAFGAVLWELLTWRLPYAELNTFQIINVIQQEGGKSLAAPSPSQLPAGLLSVLPQYLELMQACRATDPEARPKFEAIVQQLSEMLEAESSARAAAKAAAQEAAMASCEGHPKAIRVAASGPAYNKMAAMLKQRQASMAAAAEGAAAADAPSVAAADGSGPPAAPDSRDSTLQWL